MQPQLQRRLVSSCLRLIELRHRCLPTKVKFEVFCDVRKMEMIASACGEQDESRRDCSIYICEYSSVYPYYTDALRFNTVKSYLNLDRQEYTAFAILPNINQLSYTKITVDDVKVPKDQFIWLLFGFYFNHLFGLSIVCSFCGYV